MHFSREYTLYRTMYEIFKGFGLKKLGGVVQAMAKELLRKVELAASDLKRLSRELLDKVRGS